MRLILAVSLVLAIGAPILAANGRSITVCWRHSNNTPALPEGSLPDANANDMMPAGALVRFDISNNSVTKVDTIVKMTTAFCQYPAWSLDGSRIAFFRWPYRISGSTLQKITGDNPSLCIVDMNGKNLKNLTTLPSTPGIESSLDWPADGWIYYAKPRSDVTESYGKTGTDIWKVNPYAANPASTDQKVVTLEPNCGYIRRFSLSLDATRAAFQAYAIYPQTCATPNHEITFPGLADLGGSGSCNDKISASGNYAGGFMGGAHAEVCLRHWNGSQFIAYDFTNFDIPHTSIFQAFTWAGFNMGSDAGVQQICFSSNSDKWYCENVAWHYGGFRRGVNQLILNWVDKQAIIPTKNPDTQSSNGIDPNPGLIAYCSFSGDFWVKPSSSQNDYAYEDTAGAWHQMSKPSGWSLGDTSLVPTSIGYRSGRNAAATLTAAITSAGILSVSLPDGRAYAVSITDMSGKVLAVRYVRGVERATFSGVPRGACVVRAASDSESPGGRMLIAR